MKKLCIVLLILTIIFSVSAVMAQNNLIGPLVGLNLASVDIEVKDVDQDISTSIRPGFAFGGSFYLALSSSIGLQFEPAYMQKGSKVEVKWVENGSNIEMDQILKANHIDIPILFKASFGQGNTKPYVLAGANVALRTSDVTVEVDKVTVDGQDITSQIPSGELEDELKTTVTDFGLNFGAGILFPIGTNHFFIEGQYNIGLKNIYDEEDADEVEVKTKGILIKAGIFFTLGGSS